MTLLDEQRPGSRSPAATERPRRRESGDLGWIGEGLGRNFDHVAAEPLPPQVRELLAKLDAPGR